MTDRYLLPSELRALADLCESLSPVWDKVTVGDTAGIETEFSESFGLRVSNAEGEDIGFISWADDGAALYLSKPDE